MRATYLAGIVAIAALAATAGCTRRGRAVDPDPGHSTAVTTARITNKNWLDARVYAVRSGLRERIGIVRAFDTQVFDLPRHLVETRGLALYINLIGSPQSYQTDVIPVWPGQVIELVVQEQLAQSHYSVIDP